MTVNLSVCLMHTVGVPNRYEPTFKCNLQGSVHRKYIPIYIQKMHRCTVYLYLETALHISDGISTLHQEHSQQNLSSEFNVGSYIPIYIQKDAALHSLFTPGNCCTCFGWYLHPSSGAHTTVSTCQTVTATCRCSGRWQ